MKQILIPFFSFFCGLTLSAQTPGQLKSWLPEIEGWTIADEVEVFTPDNLFNRINGSAPLFIENNFKEMTALEYVRGDEYITIQAYRHGSPEDTFGMYASERSPDMTFYAIGGEAQGDDTNIYFFAGNIYVKIWANDTENAGELLKKIATGFAAKIDPDAAYPAIVHAFPVEGKAPNTEAYITSNYIGHTFLNGVYTANYNLNGQNFQAFIIDAKTEEGAKDMLNKYFDFTKQPKNFTPGRLLITDRYNGDIPALWEGRYVLGVFSESGDIEGADSFLNALAKELKQ